jgi:hypothetical protein
MSPTEGKGSMNGSTDHRVGWPSRNAPHGGKLWLRGSWSVYSKDEGFDGQQVRPATVAVLSKLAKSALP